MTEIIIRPVRPEDYPALSEASRSAFPGGGDDAETLLEEDQENLVAPLKFERFVAEVDGQVVGSMGYFQSLSRYHAQKFWLDGYVHADYQKRGIGSALADRLQQALAVHNPIQVRAALREDQPQSLAFLTKRGFTEGKRTWVSSLDLNAFDASPYAGVIEQVQAQGIRLTTLADLQSQPGWEQKALDQCNEVQLDVPDIDPAVALTMEQFQASTLQNKNLVPQAHFLALDGDKWVGISSLWPTNTPGLVGVGLTGTARAYRGRQIALALKLLSIEYAKAQGYTSMRTMNASNNGPMLAINVKLGFTREPAWIHMVRTF